MQAPILPGKTEFSSVEMRSSSTLELCWQKAPHADGYLIYERAETSSKYQMVKKVAAGDIVSYNRRVEPGKVYFYKIKPFIEDTDGRRMYGAESPVMQGSVLSGPPQILSAEKIGSMKEKITWTEVEGADGYVLRHSEKADGNYRVCKSIANKGETVSAYVYGDGTGYYKMCAYRLVDGVKRFTDYTEPFAAYNQK